MPTNRTVKRLVIRVPASILQVKVNEATSFKVIVRMTNIMRCKLSASFNKKFLKIVYPKKVTLISSKLFKSVHRIELKFKALKKTTKPIWITVHAKSNSIYQAALLKVIIK